MKQLEALSAVGFGTYRLHLGEKEHTESLNEALNDGCNLIDTAPTYGNGEAEQVVGSILKEREDKECFVITKAGYINAFVLSQLNEAAANKILRHAISIGENDYHSIHPDFISFQMTGSENRLRRKIDGFLLHNPEYHFSCSDDKIGQYFEKIKSAFEFLEEQVSSGRIRYYGVSSNELTVAQNNSEKAGLRDLIRIAEEISSNHHFKLVQFPFNVLENDAARNINGKSLIESAKDLSLITFSNRALNSNQNNHGLRLANYTLHEDDIDEAKGKEIVDRFISLVSNRLNSMGVEEDIFDFIPFQVLQANWNFFENTDVVDAFMYRHLLPFLRKVFDEDDDVDLKNSLSEVYQLLINHSRRRMNENAQQVIRLFQIAGIQIEKYQSLSNAAVSYCLKNGINHVLVGMKRRQYVNDLKTLFQYETNSVSSLV